MKIRLVILLLSCCFWSVECLGQTAEQKVFEEELGPIKVEALNALTDSYRKFLYDNYPDQPTLRDRLEHFLRDMLEMKKELNFDQANIKEVIHQMEKSGLRRDIFIYSSEIESYPEYPIEKFLPKDEVHDSMKVDLGEISEDFDDVFYTKTTVKLTEEEQRAYRKRVEKQKEIQALIARSPRFNTDGLYVYALAKALQNDPFIQDVEIMHDIGEISLSLMAEGYLNHLSEAYLDTWYFLLPLIIDYYHSLLGKYVVSPDGF